MKLPSLPPPAVLMPHSPRAGSANPLTAYTCPCWYDKLVFSPLYLLIGVTCAATPVMHFPRTACRTAHTAPFCSAATTRVAAVGIACGGAGLPLADVLDAQRTCRVQRQPLSAQPALPPVPCWTLHATRHGARHCARSVPSRAARILTHGGGWRLHSVVILYYE